MFNLGAYHLGEQRFGLEDLKDKAARCHAIRNGRMPASKNALLYFDEIPIFRCP